MAGKGRRAVERDATDCRPIRWCITVEKTCRTERRLQCSNAMAFMIKRDDDEKRIGGIGER